jgi:hypothetical protein
MDSSCGKTEELPTELQVFDFSAAVFRTCALANLTGSGLLSLKGFRTGSEIIEFPGFESHNISQASEYLWVGIARHNNEILPSSEWPCLQNMA